jgi:hypothetical protein
MTQNNLATTTFVFVLAIGLPFLEGIEIFLFAARSEWFWCPVGTEGPFPGSKQVMERS